jgi:hypothetical protein
MNTKLFHGVYSICFISLPQCSWVIQQSSAKREWVCVCVCVYLVKLINEANTLVSQHQCSSLQSPLPCSWAAFHISSQTNSWCSLTSSKHCSRCYLLNILEKLWFCCTRVTTDEYIDISTHLVFLAWISNITHVFIWSDLKLFFLERDQNKNIMENKTN